MNKLKLFLATLLMAVGISTSWAQTYTIIYGNSQQNDRYTSEIQFNSPTFDLQKTKEDVLQTGPKQQVGYDLTSSQTFRCTVGERVKAGVTFKGEWLHCYLYIDENKNGFEANNAATIIDGNHILIESAECDLKSFSFYRVGGSGNGYASNGEERPASYSSDDYDPKYANVDLPEFTAPSKPGIYRMRFVITWDNINPNPDANELTGTNRGGIMVDVNLEVSPLPTSGKVYNIRFVSNQSPQKNVYVYLNGTELALEERDTPPAVTDTNYQWQITGTAEDNTGTFVIQNIANPSYYIKSPGGSTGQVISTATSPQDVTVKVADWENEGRWNQWNANKKTPSQYMIANSLYFGRTGGNVGSAVVWQSAAGSTTWGHNVMNDGGYDTGWGTADKVLTSQVLMDEIPCYNVTYKDESGNTLSDAKAIVSGGVSYIYNGISSVNRIAVGSTIRGFVGNDYLLRDFVSASIGSNTYNTLSDLLAAVSANKNVVITLSAQRQLTGKCFAIRHEGVAHNVGTNKRYIAVGSDTKLYRGTHIPNTSLKSVFAFEDAGDGKFYIYNVGTERYVERTGAASIGNDQAIPTTLTNTSEENAYRLTNALIDGNPEVFAFADATEVTDPIAYINTQRYLYAKLTNQWQPDYTQVVRWSTNNTYTQGNEVSNAHWTIEEVPTIELSFQYADGTPIVDPVYTATFSYGGLPRNTVLTCFKGIYFDAYAVVGYELNGRTYTTRTQFFEDCHKLTTNANATLILRDKDSNEMDLTLQLWKAKGKGYTNEECTEGEVDFTTNADNTSQRKAWKLTVNGGDTDIKGAPIPADFDFRIVSMNAEEAVGGCISNNGNAAYHYGQVSDGPNCICFTAAINEGNTFQFRVATDTSEPIKNYYILQYNLGVISGTADQVLVLSNPNGSTVTTYKPNENQQRYTITDTPAAATCQFTAVAQNDTKADGRSINKDMAANYFRVRVVNETYLRNSMDRGLAIVQDALYDSNEGNQVGYPKATTPEYTNLWAAYEEFSSSGDNLDKYLLMLQAYSKYISCTDLNMPEDCKVYTLSFIKPDGIRMLLNNGVSGLELVEYNASNRSQTSARWISHKNEETGKTVLVNKKDGYYLQAKHNTSTRGVSECYDANTTAFEISGINQDLSDYMASATDEKLLGAIYLKTPQRVGNASLACVLSINSAIDNNDFVAVKEPFFNNGQTSAVLMELVDGGDTYNNINFRKSGEYYYATYYGFYPVANPDDVEMYYVTHTEVRDGIEYLKLREVTKNVIKPKFPVILIAHQDELVAEAVKPSSVPTHLHIGEYTSAVKSEIGTIIGEHPNKLQGTLEDGQTYTDGTIYILSGGSQGVGFYRYTGEYLPVGKAYFETDPGSSIRAFQFSFNGVETTIYLTPDDDADQKDAVIYDLSGRRLNAANNGLFIINGKKVVK